MHGLILTNSFRDDGGLGSRDTGEGRGVKEKGVQPKQTD